MAFPLVLAGLAAYGALKGAKGASAANKANAYQDALEEAERQREERAAKLYEAPQLHGAEQRKTFGNNFALGFLGNFGRDAGTGEFRAPWFKAMADDAWKYRPIDTLMAQHPSLVKGPKRPKSSVVGGALSGGLEGVAQYYAGGGNWNPFGKATSPSGGVLGGFNAPSLNPSARFGGFKMSLPEMTDLNPFGVVQ